MNIIQAAVLGVIEGLTEFLPVSSTGHMIMASRLLGVGQTDFVKSFEIIIQLGAILAVAALYARTLLTRRNLILPLIVAFVPTGILGVTLYKLVKNVLLGNAMITVVALFIGGVILMVADRLLPKRGEPAPTDRAPGFFQAAIVGLAQSVSMIPGVSRSAATIVGGLATGMTRTEAVEFSFLLSIPTMAAATSLDLIKTGFSFTSAELILLGVGFGTAFLSAVAAVSGFIAYVKRHDFTVFAVYRMAAAFLFWWFVIRP
jgi:undecaprenyl-diphosphatase